MTRKLPFFVFLLFLLAALALGQSQITTGTITGVISDQSGAVVPGAKVVLQHISTGISRSVIADKEGRYTAPLLEVGTYDITASGTGFATLISKGHTLTLGQTMVANIALKVAAIAETVTVSDEAPLVESARVEASALVNNRAVESLPLNGRRFLDLAFLTPGVSQEPERGQLSFAGQRGINSNINVDGADFNQPFFGGQRGGERANDAYVVSQEAIREFQVVRGGFAPEFGRSTGGVVNVITKSGSNAWHGGAFYYLRHKGYSPKTVLGDKVAPIRQQFGGTLSGPIKQDKTFFFTAYDGQAQHQPLIIRFNSTAGLPDSLLNQQGTFKSTNDVKTYLGKIDHQLTNGNHLTVRYNMSRNDAENGTFTGGIQTGVLLDNGLEMDRTHTVVTNLNSVISPTLLNEFRWQYSYEDRPRQNNGEGMDFNNVAGPQTTVSGCCYFGGVSYLPIVENDSRTQFTDNFSIVRSGHNIKLGFDFNRSHVNQIFRGNWRGVYIFNSVTNFLKVLNNTPGAVPDQFRIFFGDGKFITNVYDVAQFYQDTWKIHPRITLTYGVRHESALMPQPNAPNPLLPQTAQIPSDKNEWQPRVGLSWDVFGKGKTIVRAATGVFYARTPMLLLNQAFTSNGNPDVGVTFTLNSTQIKQAQSVHPEFVYPFVPDTSKASNSSYFTGAGIAGLKPDASFFASDFRNPRSLNFTAGFEQLLTSNLALSVDWVHLNTVHLERIRDVNLYPPAIGPDTSNPPQTRPMYNVSVRPNTNFNVIRSQESSSRSNYDALTVSLNKRLSRRFQFLTNYTAAWNYDDDSNERNYAGIAYTDAYNLHEDYTWSRNDIRHRWMTSGVYDLPFGFQFSGIMTVRSGLPFSAFTGTDSNKDSQYTDKPIINGVMLKRNSFRQPNFFNVDARVTKIIRIKERHRISIMADLFNMLNHRNNFYSVSSNESSTTALGSKWGTGQTPLPTFRALTLPDGTLNRGGMYVSSPFQLQMALKYSF